MKARPVRAASVRPFARRACLALVAVVSACEGDIHFGTRGLTAGAGDGGGSQSPPLVSGASDAGPLDGSLSPGDAESGVGDASPTEADQSAPGVVDATSGDGSPDAPVTDAATADALPPDAVAEASPEATPSDAMDGAVVEAEAGIGSSDAGDGSDGALACGAPAPRIEVRPPKRVVSLYLAGSDTPETDVQVRRAAFERALVALQHWFGNSMPTSYPFQTFLFEPPRVIRSRFTRAQWFEIQSGRGDADAAPPVCSLFGEVERELSAGALASLGLPPIGDPGVFYSVLAGGGATGGCMNRSLSVVEEMLADRVRAHCPNGVYDSCAKNCSDPGGLGNTDPICKDYPSNEPGNGCMMVGALAMHIGVGFGLVATPERTPQDRALCEGNTIMDAWWTYGHGVTLCEPDRRDLAASGFFVAP